MAVRMTTSARCTLAPQPQQESPSADVVAGRGGEWHGSWAIGEHTGVLLFGYEELGDLVTDLAVGQLDVVLGIAIVGHEGKETVVGDIKLASHVKGVPTSLPEE